MNRQFAMSIRPVCATQGRPTIPVTAETTAVDGGGAGESARMVAMVVSVLLLGSILMLRGQAWARHLLGFPTGTQLLVYGAMDGDPREIQQALAEGASPNTADADGNTPLIWAAKSDSDASVLMLLHAGADLSAPNKRGATPLFVAAMCGECRSAAVLLSRGANPNQYEPNIGTPLYVAAMFSNAEMVDLLLRYGADPNLGSADGRTALQPGIDPRIRQRLLAAGAREPA